MQVNEKKVTRGNAAAVKKLVIAAANSGDSVLDWTNVGAVDSSAVAIVLAWLRVLQDKNIEPQLIGVPEKMRSLMRLYGIYDLVKPALV